jgi:hypothetical protein
MLTFYDFNAMNETEKGNAVFQEGTFVDNRSENGFKVQLYRLQSFYVEVFYDAQANKILYYRSFNTITQLAPYIRLVQ